MTPECIGWLEPEADGYRAVCCIGGCAWTQDPLTRDAAERGLRSHAAATHPQIIRIYRGEAA